MSRTFFIDIDGTIVKHLSNDELDKIIYDISTNQKHESSFKEILLPGVLEFWNSINDNDKIIITTARKESHRKLTEKIFFDNGLRFDMMIMDLPSGKRILINDSPLSFCKKAIAINVIRDNGLLNMKF